MKTRHATYGTAAPSANNAAARGRRCATSAAAQTNAKRSTVSRVSAAAAKSALEAASARGRRASNTMSAAAAIAHVVDRSAGVCRVLGDVEEELPIVAQRARREPHVGPDRGARIVAP